MQRGHACARGRGARLRGARPAEVVDLASIANEESVFALRFDQIKERINANPYYEVESVRYVFPDKLRISVHERRASALISTLDGARRG